MTSGFCVLRHFEGGGPRVVVSTAAFHARVRGSVPGLGGLKETKMFLPHPRVKVSIVGSLRDREVACSTSDRQGSNFESCVWRTVSSQSSHHPQEVLLAQFSLYVHKGGLKPDSFHLLRHFGILFPTLPHVHYENTQDTRSIFIWHRKTCESLVSCTIWTWSYTNKYNVHMYHNSMAATSRLRELNKRGTIAHNIANLFCR